MGANTISGQRGQALLQGAKEYVECPCVALPESNHPPSGCWVLPLARSACRSFKLARSHFKKFLNVRSYFHTFSKVLQWKKMQGLILTICFLLSRPVSWRARSGDLRSKRHINEPYLVHRRPMTKRYFPCPQCVSRPGEIVRNRGSFERNFAGNIDMLKLPGGALGCQKWNYQRPKTALSSRSSLTLK